MISNPPVPKAYVCNGSTTRFDFPFRFLDEADLRVQREAADGTLTDLTTGDYTVFNAGDDAGGYIVTDSTYADGKIRIFLGMDTVQLNAYGNNDAFPAQSHEDALDRLTLLDAMRQEEFSRTYRVQFGDGRGMEAPTIAQRSGKLFAWDSEGDLTAVPTVKGDDILTIDASSIYFDHNGSARPRLVLDLSGAGSTIGADIPNPGGADDAVMMLQYDVPILDSGQSVVWESMVFRGWTEEGGDAPTSKHSRYAHTIQAKSQISAPLVGSDYFPQEVGCLNLVATAAAGTSHAKVEALVVSAREEAGLTSASKGVAVQAITVRTTAGPDPDDRSQISVDDGDDDPAADDDPTGARVGSYTIRLNGGTVGGVLGGYRSWSAVLASGRAGYHNGVVLGKKHTSGSYTDPETVGGWGGIWGGRSFWHENTFAVRATDAKPGWIAGGKDEPDFPCDIVSATVSAVAGRAYAVDGVPVVGARSTGWTAMTGTPSKGALAAAAAATAGASYNQSLTQTQWNRIAALEARLAAYDAALIAHGLIGA